MSGDASPRRPDGMPASADERALRRMLCAAICGASAYMDDGEAQDNTWTPGIDFMRESVDQIASKLLARRMRPHTPPTRLPGVLL